MFASAAGCGSGTDDDRQVSPSPSPSGSPSPSASSSPPAPEGKEAAYRNLALTVPADWEVRVQEDDFSRPGDTGIGPEEWTILIPGECEADRVGFGNSDEAACPHVKVLGPKAIAGAGHGMALSADGPAIPYDPSTNPSPCPIGVETRRTDIAAEAGERAAFTTRPVGDKRAAYAEVTAMCIDPENSTAADGGPILFGYDQRYWFLPESEILLVDNYGIEAMDGILAGGRLE
ncbi:hypothetical protein [Nocardiopsis halophila]|uniref:hypothetical protein n=1 Tax=Nocardiopsis halophila TaxID=141692 RepID=UPI000373BCFC|nr:hypothetical protein [Nocardiopsis halophila]